MIVFFGFHWESTGLAAANMDVLALREQMIPALAMDNVCCSITSWRTDLVLSFILSNSSMQQMPLSLSTSAPLQKRKQHFNYKMFYNVNGKMGCDLGKSV